MKNNYSPLMSAKMPQNSGGGSSQCSTSRSIGAQRFTLRSIGAQYFTRFLGSSCRVWKYVACMLLAFFISVGNVWGETLAYNVTGPTNTDDTQNNINVKAGNIRSDKTFNNQSNQKVYKLDSSNKLTITSTTANINKIVFEACNSSSGTSLANTCKVLVSTDGSTYTALNTGVIVSGGTGTNNSLTSGIFCSGYGGKTEVTIEFYGQPYRYVRVEKDGKETWINVLKVYTQDAQTITWNNGGVGTAPTSPTSIERLVLPQIKVLGHKNIGWKADVSVNVNGVSTDANTLITPKSCVQLLEAATFTAQWEDVDCVESGGEFFKIALNKVTTKKSLIANEEVDLSAYATISATGEAFFTNTGSAKGEVVNANPGYLNYNDNAVYTRIELYCPLKTGDVATFVANSGSNQISFTTEPTQSATYKTTSGSYTFPSAFNGVTTLYVWRASSNQTTIKSLTITRPAPACDPIGVAATGTATSVTYNSASLPFTMDKTTGVSKLTIEVFKNSDDSKVATYNNITPATSGSQAATGLDASTEYYYKITTVSAGGDYCDGATTEKSATFTTSAAPVANPVITAAVNEDEWGSVSPASITVTSGEAVSIDGAVLTCGGNTLTATATTATAEYTYAFVNWTGVSDGDEVTTNTTATANFSRTPKSYGVTYTTPTNGSYTIKVGDAAAVSENTTAAYGTTVTLAATPASGYRLAGWTVAKAAGSVSVTNNQFAMPAEAVTVSAAFEEIPCPTSGTVFAYTSKTGISNADINAGTYTYTPAAKGDYLATLSGGSVVAYVNADGKIRIRGSQLAFNGSESYIKLALDCELKAGDTILVNSSGNTGDLWMSKSPTRPSEETAAAIITQGTKYVVEAESALDDNVKDLYFWRSTGTVQMGAVSIIRPAKYAMTFAKGDDDASGKMDAQSVIEKSLVTLPTCTFGAPDGKEFDAWVVTKTVGGASVTVTDGKFTMPQEAVTLTATWKDETVKYGVTYVLNGPTGDAPTETDKEASQEFTLAAAPTWADHVFQGWKWTDNESVDHIEAAEAEFTMPAYAVTFTAQWKLDPQATMSDAQYVIGGSALNMAAKFSSLNTSGAIIFSLKESYEDAEITPAGSFTATVAGEYIVVAEQAGDGTYANGSAEATVEVLESELSDTYVWKKSAYTGSCVASPNEDAPAAQYTNVEVDGMASVASGRPETAGDVTITFAINNAYSSLFGIKSVCAFGKIEETAGIEYSWNNTDWTPMAGGESSDSKHEFTAPAGSFPTNLYIRFTNVETGKKGVWFRNALVTLEAKKAIKNTVIDLTDVKINNSSISAANLATLKTADAYALDLEDEYVTAPALKFNKHTVITYDDDSQVEKDDVISKTATVNLSGKWQASAEINAITYTVTMAKADAFIVHYYQADGETLIGSENVAVSGHPTAAGIMPTPQDYKRVVWKLNDVPVDLEDVTSDVAGTEISLVASYENAYATSINIEQWVLDNRKNNTAFRALLDAQNYKYGSLNDLDSLDEGKSNRNYAFLGQKIKTENAYISFLLQEGKTVKIRFGNVEKEFKIVIGETDYAQTTALNNATTASTNVYERTAAADEIIKIVCMDASKALVVKQIMIGDAPEIADVTLPWLVTYDANGGTFGKTTEKYTDTPLVIGDATPADDDHLFDGWYDGDTKINAAAYVPTKNVTLVAKYVMKPSPFSLSALTFTIGAGEAQEVGYVEGTYEYDVELPYAGSYETITVAYTLADGTSSTKAGAVLNVTSVPGAATFTVIAANETEKTYTVNFKKAAKDGLSIIKATISGGDQTAGFDAEGLYAGKGYAQTVSKKLNTGGAFVGVQLKTGETFQAGDKLYVVTSTDADRGYIELYREAAGTNLIKATGVRDASAGIALPSEAYGLNEIYIVRKTSEGDQSWNGTVNYVEVKRPMNPVMTAITLGVDEVFEVEAVKGTGNTFSATLPYGTDLDDLEATPTYYWNGAGSISAPTTWAWGANTYTLTDKDGDATVYTITLVQAEVSRDATLSALSYGGTAIDLVPGVFNYTVNLPYGTEDVPELSATKNHPGAATPVIEDAASFSNHQAVSKVTVTAQDGTTTQVYTVTFKVALCPTVVIWNGSSMSAIASSPHAASGLVWTVASDQSGKMAVTDYSAAAGPIVCADNGKTYTTFNGGNNKHECKYIATGGNTKSGRSFKITVPVDYMVQLYVVFGTHSDETARTLFIDKVVGSSVSESTVAQATNDDRYNLTALTVMLEGSKEATVDYYINANNSLDIYEIDATVISLDYTRTVTVGRMGTICVDHNVPAGYIFGAEVYKLLYWKYGTSWEDCQMVDFEQVEEMNAGEPYMIIPTSEMFGLHYGATKVDDPLTLSNGFTGTFDAIDAAYENDLYGKYGIVNNMIQKLGHNCNSLANRAYIDLSQTPSKKQYEEAQSSNPKVPRKRVSLGHKVTEGEAVATSLDAINVESEEVQKVMINGEMLIIRDGHIYTATGMLVK